MRKADGSPLAFHERISEGPVAGKDPRISAEFAELEERVREDAALADLSRLLEQSHVRDLLAGIFGGSPYVTGLVRRDLARLQQFIATAPEENLRKAKSDFEHALRAATDTPSAMQSLRRFKSDMALLVALADLAGVWPVTTVVAVMSEIADIALQSSVRFLFKQAAEKGDWHACDPEQPERGSGYIVLGMGKYGAGELNYSSDIDLIILFDLARTRLRGGLEAQSFFVRLTRDLVRLLDERTAHGYVFRTDLRLRPDAGATQAALSTGAAMDYYESVGQNWERAAFLKARPVAGDIEAGTAFLQELSPFVWRKYLDYAAIADVHAMKRQIHAFHGLGPVAIAGHNVKLGRGGIREIEFFAQTQQLIAGGRQPELRVRGTLEALDRLENRGWITASVRDALKDAYCYLRRIEHRIQMVADEQTHDIPGETKELETFARFAGYQNAQAFGRHFVPTLETVQGHYAALFENVPELTVPGANMVFAGEDDDPATLAALAGMGYSQPSQVVASVRSWHHGRYSAVRSERARERLTEVQPLLISALADTADPDSAFTNFDRFMAELPSGVQLFSLLRANPGLMRLVADIMGTAPRMARILSRRRRLLDAVLDPRTLSVLPGEAELDQIVQREFSGARDFQDLLDRARIAGSEQVFLIGVRILTGTINANQAGDAYAVLAERLILALQSAVAAELAAAHGRIAGGGASVVTMGKLGGHEMTANSDLDLIVVYDSDETAQESDGAKPLAPSQYFSRLAQRLIMALSAPTPEGTLYEVDLRLRPSGQKGPLATSWQSFLDYQAHEAWTWEHMALTRARVISGPADLRQKVEAAIHATLTAPRDREKVAADVRDMRQRILQEKETGNIWDLKQVRGGLVDMEFIAQYLQLVHAASHAEILDQNTTQVFRKLERAGLLATSDAEKLRAAARLTKNLGQIIRLCLDGPFDPELAPNGLKELLARAGDAPSFASLEANLRQSQSQVAEIYEKIIS